jgi:hypothetical protein
LRDGEPELHQVEARPHEHAFQFRRLPYELQVLRAAAEAHHPLHARRVVPGSVEEHDLAGHTTLTWVEGHFGYGAARAYAGHTDSTGPATTTYIKADLYAVGAAVSAMTGQPHPLAGAIAPSDG